MTDPTLTVGTQTLVLPSDLDWTDELSWQPVVQAVEYTLTGALIVESAVRQAGRPITLAGSADRAWMTRQALAQLEAWAAIPGQVLALRYREQACTVMFRHQDAPAIEAQSVIDYADPVATDWYIVTLKLMQL